ncbi:hypothetical protein GY45DRAFT_1274344 [Cubamyces sp. BRFM 1775]|nr:hypothetical protein GY45DRAFT_1274344 [Cubamyces sp. BRFM 1775]
MPRFLDTNTGQFVWINNPKGMRYAILSHTWNTSSEGGEQSYEDIRRIQAAAAAEEAIQQAASSPGRSRQPVPASTRPGVLSILHRPELSEKIRGFCVYAREAGYDLAWADMCCIDKSSSAELSEAINSMYEWYRLANVCYVYLADVSYLRAVGIPAEDQVPSRVHKEFRESRWHTRGWTLQELLAPRRVVFLSRTWTVLGTKLGLAGLLEEITGVDFSILTGRAELASASVAQRMSWAAHRETTRVEDRAYSLMGIFGVFMSPVYGEGHNAFLRLQEEIIRTIPDQSIFAWGSYVNISAESHSADAVTVGPISDIGGEGLLAPSPLAFKYSSNIVPVPSAEFARLLGTQRDSLPQLHCVFTPQGISIQLPCIDTTERRLYTRVKDVFFGRPKSYGRLALLRCRVQDGPFIALRVPLPSKNSYEGKDDHLRIKPAMDIRSARGFGWLNVSGRTFRLSKYFFKVARGRGWKVRMQNTLLLLASEQSAHSTYTDWGAQIDTVTKALSSPPVLELAPWCDWELGAVGLTAGDVSPSAYLPQFNTFKPLYTVISAFPDDCRRPFWFDMFVAVTVEDSWVTTGRAPIPAYNDAESQFAVTLTHRYYDTDEGASTESTILAEHVRLLHVNALSQHGATLYAERDFQIQCDEQSPFHGRLLRVTVQSAPPDKTPGNVTGESSHTADESAGAERFWISIEASANLYGAKHRSNEGEDDDEDLSGCDILLWWMFLCFYAIYYIGAICLRFARSVLLGMQKTVLRTTGMPLDNFGTCSIQSVDIATSHNSAETAQV